jgi:paraquat-inducible protein B
MAPADGPALTVRMVYEQSVRGLAVGAPVDFLGVEIGTVRALSPQYDPVRRRYPMEVTADIYPLRLGKVRETMVPGAPLGDTQADISFLRTLVDHGMRAQLRTGNLLTGQQYVALDFDPKAPRATLDVSNGVPRVPTQPGTLNELQPQIAEIVAKLAKVPFEDIGRDLRSTLSTARNAIAQLTPDAQRALAGVERTLAGVQESLNRLDRNLLDPSAPVQRQVEDAMTELQRAAQALRALGEYLQRHPESILRGKPPDPPLSETREKSR